MKHPSSTFIIIWEFSPRKGRESEFELAYGSNGDWAKFFSSGKGYIGTDLHRDIDQANRYLTIDEWTSREAFETFKDQRQEEYHRIDKKCESLTEYEKLVGLFERLKD